MSKIDTKLCYLELRTDGLTDQTAQLILNNQKENRHPHCHSRTWVCQQRRMGPAPMTGAEAQMPPAEGNNPSVSHNVPFTKQKVFQTLHDNLQWLNPKNWFNGLNLRVWVLAALGCLLVLILICALPCGGCLLKIAFGNSK